ncbi:HD-GYP domain-containing protein [Marinospirillum perlucidum]|uniref:HD-GYP domain-containing protein n=1 Tax=Marinospirillum perlucidum TaxID=1982602 RepID=UPI000DF1C901|nr:HD domain-containing phosphohydrolase [Marinospirillum perlucidum]
MLPKDFRLLKVAPGELLLNQPVPWTICDNRGEVLLQQGSLIDSKELKKLLEQVGFFAREEAANLPQPTRFRGKVNPFAEFDDLCVQLDALFKRLESGKNFAPGLIAKRVITLATQIQGLVHYDADALMGAVHLTESFDYPIQHPMQISVLTELILERLKVEQPIRLSVICAALTCNLGMNPFQKRLDQQKGPLTAAQKDLIRRHPLISSELLRAAGVEDELWLELVAQHHEKLDGQGYPRGLSGEAVRHEARILALADVYSAMVTPRGYRGPLKLKDSLKDLFEQRGKAFDGQLTELFIMELGLYPPGVYVRLSNDDLAVVVGRTKNPKAPQVASIRRSDGYMYPSPLKRNLDSSDLAVKYVCDASEKIRINPATLWGIDALRVDSRTDLSSVDPFMRGLI